MAQLPDFALPLVFGSLDRATVLGICPLVCQNWRQAAAKSATSLLGPCGQFGRPANSSKLQSMLKFFSNHPNYVTCLKMSSGLGRAVGGSAAQPLTLDLGLLPCMPNLKELFVYNFHLVFKGPAQAPLTGSMQLTQLNSVVMVDIFGCSVEGSAGVLGVLAQLPALETLKLHGVYSAVHEQPSKSSAWSWYPGCSDKQYTTIPCESFPHMTKLTSLKLAQGSTARQLLVLSTLTALQDICLSGAVADLTAEQQWQLPAQLTKVELCLWGQPITSQGAPFALLTGLQHLCINHCTVQLQALSHLVQLHTLQLQQLSLPVLDKLDQLQQYQAPWSDEDSDSDSEHSGSEAAAAHRGPQPAAAAADAEFTVLLSWLARLQQLTHFELGFSTLYDCDFVSRLPAAALTGVTASSGLQQLKVEDIWWPDTAWPHIFAAGRKLLHLTSLILYRCSSQKARALPPQLLQQVAAACPALAELGVWLTPQQDGQLAQLQQLTALSKLSLWCSSNMQAAQLAGLTGLKDLQTYSSQRGCSLTHQGLVLLTALTQLTRIETTVILPSHVWPNLHIEIKGGGSSSVSSLLLQRCMACTCCQQPGPDEAESAGAAKGQRVQGSKACKIWDRS